jgi:hypothetical protein
MNDMVEEDGDEIFTPFADVRCWAMLTCGGSKLSIMKHDNNDSLHWRCPKCGGYYGDAPAQGQ